MWWLHCNSFKPNDFPDRTKIVDDIMDGYTIFFVANVKIVAGQESIGAVAKIAPPPWINDISHRWKQHMQCIINTSFNSNMVFQDSSEIQHPASSTNVSLAAEV